MARPYTFEPLEGQGGIARSVRRPGRRSVQPHLSTGCEAVHHVYPPWLAAWLAGLRHSAATFLLAESFTLEDVKNLLGHSTIVLTSNTYGHVLEQRKREVVRGMNAVLG